jgi:murein DD-endopeptidase MepM/ murein hydrolase activator NlpD
MSIFLKFFRRLQPRAWRYRHMRSMHPMQALAQFMRHAFRHKKIVVISDRRIVSIPISTRVQAMMMAVVGALMLWVSYASGKYFAFESILSEKEHEIWTTNLNNEDLQLQVENLHSNLAELNKYFDHIQKFDQTPGLVANNDSDIVDEKVQSYASNEAVGRVLMDIRGKLQERISILEGVIAMTGVQLEELSINNGDLKRALMEYRKYRGNSSGANSGGPFIPADSLDQQSQWIPSLDREDFERNVSYLLKLEQMIHVMPLAGPMRRYYITSGFGTRMDPYHRVPAMHAGVDLVGLYREKIYSTAPGVVVYARFHGAYGRMVEVDHGQGITTRYAHLDKIFVSPGDRIKRGQLLGLQGNSGRSTGTHLHYEVRYNDKPLDPEHFLKAGRYVF